jgi:hypothetical protein
MHAIGLGAALMVRILVLLLFLALAGLQNRWIFNLATRDLLLLSGGLFLLWKAVTEIHHTVELKEETSVRQGPSGLGDHFCRNHFFRSDPHRFEARWELHHSPSRVEDPCPFIPDHDRRDAFHGRPA